MSTNTTAYRETESPPRSRDNRDQVARRAYQLWEAAGRPAGRDLEYWLQAESEIHSASYGHSPKAAVPGDGPKRESASAAAPAAPAHEAEKPEPRKTVPLLAGGTNDPRGTRPGSSKPRSGTPSTRSRFSGGM